MRTDRGKPNPAIADDNGGHAMVGRRGKTVIPSGLTVVVGMGVDETRSNKESSRFDDFGRAFGRELAR